MKLYEIAEDIRRANDLFESGEMSIEDMTDTLEGMEFDFNTKVESTALVIKEYLSTADAIKANIERLTDLKRANENRASYLKEYVRLEMEKAGISKVDGTLAKITLGKPTQVVEITGSVPAEFIVTTEREDKTAIKKALASGDNVPGAELVAGKSKLIIK